MESVSWQSAHYKEPYASQRQAKFPAKLARLGLKGEDRSVRLLDTCCGRGDALSVLIRWGFTSLAGLDATPHVDWKNASVKIHEGDVTAMPFADASFDVVLNCHSLHHMGSADGVRKFLSEVRRVLVPGGRLHIIDFPGSPQVLALFHMLHNGIYPPTGGLRNFAEINDEEWHYLIPYLKQWSAVKRELANGPLRVKRWKQRFWLYYLTLVKD